MKSSPQIRFHYPVAPWLIYFSDPVLANHLVGRLSMITQRETTALHFIWELQDMPWILLSTGHNLSIVDPMKHFEYSAIIGKHLQSNSIWTEFQFGKDKDLYSCRLFIPTEWTRETRGKRIINLINRLLHRRPPPTTIILGARPSPIRLNYNSEWEDISPLGYEHC